MKNVLNVLGRLTNVDENVREELVVCTFDNRVVDIIETVDCKSVVRVVKQLISDGILKACRML